MRNEQSSYLRVGASNTYACHKYTPHIKIGVFIRALRDREKKSESKGGSLRKLNVCNIEVVSFPPERKSSNPPVRVPPSAVVKGPN